MAEEKAVGYPSSIEGAIGALVARRKTESKRMVLNSRSLQTVLDTFQELQVPYTIVNKVIVPVFKSKEEAERCKEALKAKRVRVP